jgi:glycosyltransferase 2 family protein
MTAIFARKSLSRRVAVALLTVAVAASVGTSLSSYWRPLLDAIRSMAAGPMALAFGLCLIHRMVNAHGWTLVLRALGQPMPTAQGARIWLSSEACRWLPGSVWSYGSRGVLAARAGVPAGLAAVSLVWELILTILAWVVVAGVSILLWKGPVPEAVLVAFKTLSARPWLCGFVAVPSLAVVVALGSKAVGRRLSRFASTGRYFGQVRTDRRAMICVLGFYVTMAFFNGLTFWQVMRAAPDGARCPVAVVVAANSVAWLVGFFALFAPGGLVVREASIVVLLSGWLRPEQAVTVALAWRAVQVAAELVGCLAIVLLGLSRDGSGRSRTSVATEGIEV